MRGPKAPKDPVAKRPAVYVMVDSVIEGSPRGNGKFQDICYLNGRIAQKISVLCNDMPKEILEAVPTGAGFRKLVHTIGVTVLKPSLCIPSISKDSNISPFFTLSPFST